MTLFIYFSIIVVAKFTSAVECGSVPTNGCSVTQNTTFNQGTYNLPNGINIGMSNTLLNCNGSTLVGSSSNNGINNDYYDNTVITNCIVKNYTNGIRLNHVYSGACGPTYSHDSSNNNTVKNTILTNNSVGLLSSGEPNCDLYNRYNQLINSDVNYNGEGIKLIYSEFTNISQNILKNNFNNGINITKC